MLCRKGAATKHPEREGVGYTRSRVNGTVLTESKSFALLVMASVVARVQCWNRWFVPIVTSPLVTARCRFHSAYCKPHHKILGIKGGDFG
jgi:hypothetical protein